MPKVGYNPVPDAEAPLDDGPSSRSKEAAKLKYGLEGEQEGELLAMIDSACEMKPTFNFPAVDPDELISQGKSFLSSMIAPTISVACTMAIAWLLSATSQGDDWIAKVSTFLTPIFPYFNAVVVFMASFLPIQQRFMDSVEPIFDKIDGVQADAERNVDDLANRVDTIVDRIQAKVKQVLAPYLPKLAMATKMEVVVKKVKPDIDIPDPSDIDREFDEAQGLVTTKLDKAKERIDIHSIIPTVLQSSQVFFWRIVVPFGVLALAIQLLVVALTPQPSMSSDSLGNLTSTLHDSSASLQSQLNTIQASADDASTRRLWATPYTTSSHHDWIRKRALKDLILDDREATGTTTQASHALADATTNVDTYRDQAVDDAKAEAVDAMNQVSDTITNATATMDSYRDTAMDDVKKGVDDAQNQANEVIATANATLTGYQSQAQEQILEAKSQIKPMLTSIAISYLIALLQLALAYILSGDKIKTFCINMALKIAKGQFDKVLEDSGVPATIDDVLVTRMERIRDKLLKILKVAGELDDILDKIPGGGDAVNKAGEALGKLGGRFGLR